MNRDINKEISKYERRDKYPIRKSEHWELDTFKSQRPRYRAVWERRHSLGTVRGDRRPRPSTALLFSRTFGSVLDLCCPTQLPLGTWGHGALEICLVGCRHLFKFLFHFLQINTRSGIAGSFRSCFQISEKPPHLHTAFHGVCTHLPSQRRLRLSLHILTAVAVHASFMCVHVLFKFLPKTRLFN